MRLVCRGVVCALLPIFVSSAGAQLQRPELGVEMAGFGVQGERAPLIERPQLTHLLADPTLPNSAWNAVPAHVMPLLDIAPIQIEDEGNRGLQGIPTRIGANRMIDGGLTPSNSGQWIEQADGSRIWRLIVRDPNARAIRLLFSAFDLPEGATLVVAGQGGERDIEAYEANGPAGNGEVWTVATLSDTTYVEYYEPAHAAHEPVLVLSEVSHIYSDEFAAGDPQFGNPFAPRLLPCQESVACHSVDAIARDSVGRMIFTVSGQGTFVCTGGLLADSDPGTTLGYFLTANHCISTQSTVNSLTVYWFYQPSTCGGSVPSLGSLPRSNGGTLLANSSSSDFSFIQLPDPVAGQGLAGWTTDSPVGTVTGIHHPGGSWKRVSFGTTTLAQPICGSLPTSRYWYGDWAIGMTEGGSSGSPLFNSNWQVIGQLFGACLFSNPGCNNPQDWNWVYGKLSHTHPFVETWLGNDPGGGGPCTVTTVDDTDTADQGETIFIDVQANDTQTCGGVTLTLDNFITPAGGFVAISTGTGPGGRDEIAYIAPSLFTGDDSFDYHATAGTGETDTATVTVTVTGTCAITTNDDTASATGGTTVIIDVLANDTESCGGVALTLSSSTTPNGGTVTVSSGTGPGGRDEISYTAPLAFNGVDTFAYGAESGAVSDSADVDVTVTEPSGTTSQTLMSFRQTTLIPGAPKAFPHDIVSYDPSTGTWAQVFDGSDVGANVAKISGFAVIDGVGGPEFVMTFHGPVTIPGIIGGPGGSDDVDNSDMVRFVPTSLGTNTAGSFHFYFDGSDVSLTNNAENIDALDIDTNGDIYISTMQRGNLGGLPSPDEDVMLFVPTSVGASTAGSWSRYIDGSDVGLADSSSEDVDAFSLDPASSDLFFSTLGPVSMPGPVSGEDEDIFRFEPTSTGSTTAGTWSLEHDLSALGIEAIEDIGGMDALDYDILSALRVPPQGRQPVSASQMSLMCPGDFNLDDVADTRDVLDFLAAFSRGDRDADWDMDGELNTSDVLGFLAAFGSECRH